MEQRDYLLKEIERIGYVLQKALSSLFKLKDKGNIETSLIQTNELLKKDINLDLEYFFSIQKDEIPKYIENRNLSSDHIEILIDYIIEVASIKESTTNKIAIAEHNKALDLIEYVLNKTKTYSFELAKKKSNILKILNS